MKLLAIGILVTCAGLTAQADQIDSTYVSKTAINFNLPTDAIALAPLGGKIVGMNRLENGYRLIFDITVMNCSDEISPIAFSENSGVVTISVWNIARKLSFVAPCASNPTFREEIVIKSKSPFTKAVFLGVP